MNVFITGSSGLIGSELVSYFDQRVQSVFGTDNNMRADFFGPEGDTRWNLHRLMQITRNFRPYDIDVRDRHGLQALFREKGLSISSSTVQRNRVTTWQADVHWMTSTSTRRGR